MLPGCDSLSAAAAAAAVAAAVCERHYQMEWYRAEASCLPFQIRIVPDMGAVCRCIYVEPTFAGQAHLEALKQDTIRLKSINH